MAALKLSLVAVLVLASLAAARDSPYGPPPPAKGMPYAYEYAVQDEPSGNDFGAQEASDGTQVTGSYYVRLPDSRLQRVTYTADHDTGFVANVEYEGEAVFPVPSQTHPGYAA